MKKTVCLTLALWIAVITLTGFATLGFAEGGDGSGGGSGGGSSEAFAFVSSSVISGATGVDVNATIDLAFNKNVVNLSVKENNKKCFTLTDSSGTAVAFTVEMGDDQIDNSDAVKRHIHIKPNKALAYSTTYTLVISKNLQAKNGSCLSDNPDKPNDITITFTTAAAPQTTATQATTAKVVYGRAAAPTKAVTTTAATTVTTTLAPRTTRPRRVTTTAGQTTAAKASTTLKPTVTVTTVTVPSTATVPTLIGSVQTTLSDNSLTATVAHTAEYETEYFTNTTDNAYLTSYTEYEPEPEGKSKAVLAAACASAVLAVVCIAAIKKKV